MLQQNITDAIKDNFMPYSTYVIRERALPAIDGFKPSQRRILYTMFDMGLSKGGRKKSQGVVGRTMFLHPHGDSAIYEALVRLSRDAESLGVPYIDSKGNFGKQWSRDMMYASARYTEVRLESVAEELFHNINKDAVDMVDNYDGTLKEPKMLPVTFPSILVNPQLGTAVGMASSIAPFNINEVIDFTIAYIKNPKNVVVSDYIKAPDFPTGASVILNQNEFDNIYETGRGSFKIRATYEIHENSIIFRDIPYSTTFEAIRDKIVALVKEGKIKDIVDIDDVIGINSKGIEVTVKKNTNKELLIEQLFAMTTLQDNFSCNFNMIINGSPKVLGIRDIIGEWVKFRAETVRRSAKYDKGKKEHKRRMLAALKEVLLDIDKAISIIREIKKNDEVISTLMKSFNIDEEQAEFVANIKLRHLNKEYLINRIEEIKVIDKEIADLDDIISNKKTLAKLMIKQMQDVKSKHGKERRTKIIEIKDVPKVNITQSFIEDYNVRVFVTKEGYLKKIPLTSLRGTYTIKVKDGDSIVNEIETTNDSDLLVFTDKYNVYKYKMHELDDNKPSQLGYYIPALVELDDEEILFTTVTNDYKGYLLIGFEDGKLAKIDMSAYKTKTNRSMLKNAYANKKALYFSMINDDIDIVAVSSIDKVLIANTSIINAKTSKTTIGTTFMKSKNDSFVKSYHKLNKDYEEAEYYRTAGAGVGKYLRDGDLSDLITQ